VHGREAYRRNSYLISYMFYKNAIFVFPLFWYGFVSVFSGLSFYENILYQVYNIFFTGVPIMFYALYDFEHSKFLLMNDPKYYKIGYNDECFNKWIFWRWIFYGIWQGAMVLFVGFYSMEEPDSKSGRTGSYLTDGQFIYMSVVTLVNIKILTSTHTYSFFSFFLTLGSIATFILFYFILNLWPAEDIYMEFS